MLCDPNQAYLGIQHLVQWSRHVDEVQVLRINGYTSSVVNTATGESEE